MDRLDELAIFVAILETGSLVAAGRRLNRSAAAVTRALAGLEDRLGCRLIERSTRRLMPTDAGRMLGGQARQLLIDYGALTEQAEGDGQIRGRLRVTAPVIFGRRHVMPMISAFLQRHDQLSIELYCSDGNLDLIDQELDIAVRIGSLTDSGLVARRVGQVRRILVASPAYLADRGRPMTLEDLAQHAVIFTASYPALREWRFPAQGREHVLRLAPRLVTNQVEASLEAARSGLGIARVLSYQVSDDLAAGRLVRLLPETEPEPLPVHLLVPASRYMPARVRAFLDFAADTLARLPALVQEEPGEGA